MKQTNIIIGKMNHGKTKNFLFKEVDSAIKQNENILILDLKEEYYQKYLKTLNKNNYEIVVINLKEPLKSNSYNPFTLPYQYYHYGNIDKAVELISSFAGRLFRDDYFNGDPFWTNSAKDLFIGLSLLLFKEAQKEEINLASIRGLLDIDMNILKDYFNKLDVLDPIYVAASGTVFAPTDTKGSILSVCKQKINEYVLRPNLTSLLADTNFDLINYGSKKIALFIIPRDDKNDINNIACMLVDQIIYKLKENKLNCNLFLDNIDSINKIDSLTHIIDNTYSNIKVFIATRDIDDLEKHYGISAFKNIMNRIEANDEIDMSNDILEYVEYPTLTTKYHVFDGNNILKEE